jgi:hypothetical protein
MSGNSAEMSGRLSGFLKKPDINLLNEISGLDGKCRVCQVFYREREPRRISALPAAALLGLLGLE